MYGPSPQVLVFLEEHELVCWRYFVQLLDNPEAVQINDAALSLGSSASISAILLGQASEDDVHHARNALASVRQKLAMNEKLDEEIINQISSGLKVLTRASVDVEGEPITEIIHFAQPIKRALQQLLKRCVFLVRKGAAMDRMYEEPHFTLPGVLVLEHRPK
jgi:hypothetical protein